MTRSLSTYRRNDVKMDRLGSILYSKLRYNKNVGRFVLGTSVMEKVLCHVDELQVRRPWIVYSAMKLSLSWHLRAIQTGEEGGGGRTSVVLCLSFRTQT